MEDDRYNREQAPEDAGAAYSDAFYREAPRTRSAYYGYSPAQWNARASEEPDTGGSKNSLGRSAATFTAACLLCVLVAVGLGVVGLYLALRIDSSDETETVSDREIFEIAAVAAEEEALPRTRDGMTESETPMTISGLTLAEVSPGAARYYDMVQGLYISSVEEDSVAEEAGLLPGDVIIALGDEEITDSAQLIRLLDQYPDGTGASLSIWRDGEQLTVTLLPAEAIAPPVQTTDAPANGE